MRVLLHVSGLCTHIFIDHDFKKKSLNSEMLELMMSMLNILTDGSEVRKVQDKCCKQQYFKS